MSSLIFESLEVKGFRGFEHLQIKHLGRINLIVGKNNVGKSSLLEALALYASQGSPQAILELLISRNEIQEDTRKLPEEEEIDAMLAIRHLFHGRPNIGSSVRAIQIGEINSIENRLSSF